MENKTDCANCPGCDYTECRAEADDCGLGNAECGMPESAIQNPKSEIGKPGYDLERANFLAWYRDATVEEFAVACKNNAAKLNAMVKKYAREIELMDIFLPRRYKDDGKL